MLAAVVLLLLTAVYGYLQFRKYKSYQGCIHADAAFILKIDTDKIYRTLVADHLLNPSYYKIGKREAIKSGLNIPANVFLYTVRSKSFQTYFCSMPVADTVALKLFLKKRLGISELKNQGKYQIGTAANNRLTVAFNKHIFAVSYSLKKEDVRDVLADLVNGKNLHIDEDPQLKKLKDLNAHLAYVFEGYTGTGEFKDGLLHIQGDFNFKGLNVNGKIFRHRVFDSNAAVKMWLNARIGANGKHNAIRIKSYSIYADSLLKYCNGYFDLELGNPVLQADTLITYQYNDNFEKQEVITPRTVKVPGVNSMISTETTGLLNQLNQNGILNNNMVNKQLFPLYSLYANTKASAFTLSTGQYTVFSPLTKSTPYFFYLEADFGKLKAQNQFPLLEGYIKQFSKLEVNALNERAGNKHFELKLHFKLKQINSLGQLF